MDHEAGDEYDCDACGGTHPVTTGKGLRVAGASERLDPAPYVRCPELGVVRLTEDGPEPVGEPTADDGDDWP